MTFRTVVDVLNGKKQGVLLKCFRQTFPSAKMATVRPTSSRTPYLPRRRRRPATLKMNSLPNYIFADKIMKSVQEDTRESQSAPLTSFKTSLSRSSNSVEPPLAGLSLSKHIHMYSQSENRRRRVLEYAFNSLSQTQISVEFECTIVRGSVVYLESVMPVSIANVSFRPLISFTSLVKQHEFRLHPEPFSIIRPRFYHAFFSVSFVV